MIGELTRSWPHSRLGEALLLSAVVHACALVLFPSLRIGSPRLPDLPTLEVLLPRPAAALPALAAEPQPEPVRTEAPPQAKPESSRPKVRSRPTSAISRPEAANPVDTPVAAAPPAEPAPAAAPAVQEAPAAPAEPVRAAAEAEPADVLFGYGRLLEQALESNQQYPRLARQRGWQGLVKMRVQFLPGGQIGQISIVRSSGFAMLDETAVAMLRSAALPPVPDGLRRREFLLDVPVEFRLRS
jgi:protein TonB